MVRRRLESRALRRAVDRIWVKLGGKHHLIGPSMLGHGPHDCGPTSLYRVVPWVSEESIHEAFLYCAETWPHGAVTNRDFQIAVKYLKLDARYSDIKETVGSLLAKSPVRCVALLPGHYIGIVDGKVLPPDIGMSHSATVHFNWTFQAPTWYRRVVGTRRSVGSNT